MSEGSNSWRVSTHLPFILFWQALMIILFGCFARYDPFRGYKTTLTPPDDGHGGHGGEGGVHGDGALTTNAHDSHQEVLKVYPMFQDVHVMIFIGFGFLMTFLKKYGLSAVSLNMLISAMSIQWSILVHGWFHRTCEDPAVSWSNCNSTTTYVDVNVVSMINADFATATILISFGVVIGITTPIQLLSMVVVEIVLFNVNEYIGRELIGTLDAGDTIFVHMFGAYFGIAVSRMLYSKRYSESDKAEASATSDMFSMIGTIFLWMYWPSFNAGGAAAGDAQQRCLINTYLSLCACVLTTFAVSGLVDSKKKFSMEHIQNATLAGGVAVGAVADFIITPVGAIIIGSAAGILSTIGFKYLTPFLAARAKIMDTCGVNNLHGMPSLLGGMISVLIAGIASPHIHDKWNESDDKSLVEIYPRRAADDWTGGDQAARQMAGITLTLAIASVGGTLTGILMRLIGIVTSDDWKGQTEEGADGSDRKGAKDKLSLTTDLFYDDRAYFHVEEP